MRFARSFTSLLALACAFGTPVLAQQSPLRGAQASPDDPFLAVATRTVANREPAISRLPQEAAVAARLAASRKQAGRAPNVVVILMDDVGWGDWGCYGGGLAIGAPTPNLDRLAAGGLRLTSAYSQPSCTPTRASILTGRLPVRTGLLRPYLPGEGGRGGGLNGEITLAELMKKAGYATHAVGKWHLGQAPITQPQNVGFDDYYGTLTSSDDYTAWREPWRNPDLANDPARRKWASEGEVMAIVEAKAGEEARPVYPIDLDTIRYVDEKLTERAVQLIEQDARARKPFFLYMGTRGAHNDNYPHPVFAGRSPARYPYKDVLVELDHRVGQVVEALRRTGQLDNTLLVVTSDNGPFAETFPDTGFTPFRSAKGSTYEGGVRVPMIVFWPGVVAPGRVADGLFDLMDLFATTLSVAGSSGLVPGDRFVDSIDQSGFLLSDAGQSARRAEYYWVNTTLSAVRVGEFKAYRAWQTTEADDTWPRLSPFQSSTQRGTYGGKIFDLYIDPKEEHALAPLKQPQIPVLSRTLQQHLATFKAFPPKVPID